MAQDSSAPANQPGSIASSGPAPKKKGGCLKWGGIGCGIIIVICIIAAFVLYMKRDTIMGFVLDKTKAAIMQQLPAEFDREESARTVESFWAALKDGRVEEDDVQRFQMMAQSSFQDGELSSEEARELLDFMAEAAGLEPTDPGGYPEETGDDPGTGYGEDSAVEEEAVTETF